MAVGQASGVVLAEASAAGCAVAEYTPTQVKSAVTGTGSATKDQVQRMVVALVEVGSSTPRPPADVFDALALAICHLAAAPLHARIRAAG
jgi:crossover junction endodeoxyribonuclease RuvC